MRIILSGETELRLQLGGPDLEIESTSPVITFSPLHMLAASLATCTYSVLLSWALPAGLEIEDLELVLNWEYVEDPYRVGSYDLLILWPSLPPNRREAAVRVSQYCTVKNTLAVPPRINIGLGS